MSGNSIIFADENRDTVRVTQSSTRDSDSIIAYRTTDSICVAVSYLLIGTERLLAFDSPPCHAHKKDNRPAFSIFTTRTMGYIIKKKSMTTTIQGDRMLLNPKYRATQADVMSAGRMPERR